MESGGFCEVRGAIYQRDDADLIEAGLNEDAGNLRSGLWGLFEVIRRDRDLVDRRQDQIERACVMIGGNSDILCCHIHRPAVLSRETMSPRAKDRPVVAVDLGGAIVVVNADHYACRHRWAHDVSHRNGEAAGRGGLKPRCISAMTRMTPPHSEQAGGLTRGCGGALLLFGGSDRAD